jgi:Ca2+-binding RTX toxin-like protein
MLRAPISFLIAVGWPLAIGLPPLEANAAEPACYDRKATMVGTTGNDVLKGTEESDVIVGLGGDDRILGHAGLRDWICAGSGADVVRAGRSLKGDIIDAGRGDDRVFGSPGRWDEATGGPGNDVLIGRKGIDLLGGDAGNDRLFGGASTPRRPDQLGGGTGKDRLFGQGGYDILNGSSHDDVLFGGKAADTLEGNGGDDVLRGGFGNDFLQGDYVEHYDLCEDYPWCLRGRVGDDSFFGGPGLDWAGFSDAPGPVRVDLVVGSATGEGTDSLVGMENISGTDRDDRLSGNARENIVLGGPGDDQLLGRGRDDRLDGEGGYDSPRPTTNSNNGGTGNDTCLNPNSAEGAVNCEA